MAVNSNYNSLVNIPAQPQDVSPYDQETIFKFRSIRPLTSKIPNAVANHCALNWFPIRAIVGAVTPFFAGLAGYIYHSYKAHKYNSLAKNEQNQTKQREYTIFAARHEHSAGRDGCWLLGSLFFGMGMIASTVAFTLNSDTFKTDEGPDDFLYTPERAIEVRAERQRQIQLQDEARMRADRQEGGPGAEAGQLIFGLLS